MQDHYSTVASEEQRSSIARVIDLFGGTAEAGGTPSGTQASGGGASHKKAG
jgi:hypothetical protein